MQSVSISHIDLKMTSMILCPDIAWTFLDIQEIPRQRGKWSLFVAGVSSRIAPPELMRILALIILVFTENTQSSYTSWLRYPAKPH